MKKHEVKYIVLLLFALPLLPVIAFQAWLLKRRIPMDDGPDDIRGTAGSGNRHFSLVTLGESTIAGAGVSSHKIGFTGTLADSLAEIYEAKVDWEVVAKSGYSAGKVSRRLIDNIQSSSPDLIIIGLGANDAFEFTSPGKWRKDVKRIIKILKKNYPEAKLYFLNMPPVGSFPALPFLLKFFCGRFVKILGIELDEVVKQQKNVSYLNETIELTDWAREISPDARLEDLFSDGIHPSVASYQLWGKEAAERISL